MNTRININKKKGLPLENFLAEFIIRAFHIVQSRDCFVHATVDTEVAVNAFEGVPFDLFLINIHSDRA